MKSVLLMNSGGPDCAAIAKKLHDDGFDVHSLYLDIGSKNRLRAMEAAAITADLWASQHDVLTVELRTPDYIGEQGLKQAPALAAVCISIAASYGGANGYTEAYFGFQWEICGDDADEWREVERKYFDLVQLNNRIIERHFPIWNMDKKEMLDWANIRPIDLGYTVSCNEELPDGDCWKCKARTNVGIPVEG